MKPRKLIAINYLELIDGLPDGIADIALTPDLRSAFTVSFFADFFIKFSIF